VGDTPDSAAAEIAREVNAHILALEARLHEISVHSLWSDDDLIGLCCECGCMGTVASTRADYERNGGAWIEGHETSRPR
jgi:predicted component of type VI protein secretion system